VKIIATWPTSLTWTCLLLPSCFSGSSWREEKTLPRRLMKTEENQPMPPTHHQILPIQLPISPVHHPMLLLMIMPCLYPIMPTHLPILPTHHPMLLLMIMPSPRPIMPLHQMLLTHPPISQVHHPMLLLVTYHRRHSTPSQASYPPSDITKPPITATDDHAKPITIDTKSMSNISNSRPITNVTAN
jgi:hypothetical protein